MRCPRQIRRMIMIETATLLAAAAIPATPTGMAVGRAVLATLKSTHQVSNGVGYRFGATTLTIGFGDVALAAPGRRDRRRAPRGESEYGGLAGLRRHRGRRACRASARSPRSC